MTTDGIPSPLASPSGFKARWTVSTGDTLRQTEPNGVGPSSMMSKM